MECWVNFLRTSIHFSYDVTHYSTVPVFHYDFAPNLLSATPRRTGEQLTFSLEMLCSLSKIVRPYLSHALRTGGSSPKR